MKPRLTHNRVATRLGLALALLVPTMAQAQEGTPVAVEDSPALQKRADGIVGVLNGAVPLEAYFSDGFLKTVPPERFTTIANGLAQQYGRAERLVAFRAETPYSGTATIAFARAEGRVQITLEPMAEGRVSGFWASDFKISGDTPEQIINEIILLEGQTSVGIYELGGTAPRLIAGHDSDRSLAVASQFKLYILAELGAQFAAGKRNWSDVVTGHRPSFSSPETQNWPQDAPVTLHTLATWMIASSDNGATDTLVALMGREAIEARIRAAGHARPDDMTPLLSTVETFALKMPVNDALRARYLAANDAAQRQIIDTHADGLTLSQIQSHAFAGSPLHIDTVEWFASAQDIARLMQGFTGLDATTARTIMAVNPGIAPAAAQRWRYLGYKGGSESGVFAMGFLVQHRDGRWLCIQGAWNNTSAPVDGETFAALMQRLLTYYAD